MAVYQRTYRDKNTGKLVKCETYTYDFIFNGERYKGSTNCTGKTRAKEFEKDRRKQLERALSGLPTERPEIRVRTVSVALREYEEHYSVDHAPKSVALVRERSAHLKRLLGSEIAADLTEPHMQQYRKKRLKDGAGTRTIDMELEVLSRAFGTKWSVWWPKLKRLDKGSDAGKVVTPDAEQLILEAAKTSRSRYLYPYLITAFTTGMRSGEIRQLRWNRFILGPSPEESYVRVGPSKTEAGEDRVIPQDETLWNAITQYRQWYISKLGDARPDWYVFPFSKARKPMDPTRPTTTIKTAWQNLKGNLKEALGVNYRLHDARHTVATALFEADVPEAKRRYLMGHVDEKVIDRYTHVKGEQCREDHTRALKQRREARTVPLVPPVSDGVPPVSTPVAKARRKKATA